MTVPLCGPFTGVPPGSCQALKTGAWIDVVESAQILAPVTAEIVDFDRVLFEQPPTDGDAATDSITIGADGVYFIGFGATYANNGNTGPIATSVLVNNTGVPQLSTIVNADGVNPTSTFGGALVPLQAGDVLTLGVFQDTDAPLPLVSAALSAGLMACT